KDIAALEARTEGWIAALQLAALSMQGRADVAGFIAGFAGDNRYIVDYLVEEVLRRQPGHVRGFLLQTSILDRMSGPLCDAVTAARACGTSRTVNRRRRFVTPCPPVTSSMPPLSSSWRSRLCFGPGRSRSSVAGWTPFPTRWSGSGRYSPSAWSAR